jgi:hypothetical protein
MHKNTSKNTLKTWNEPGSSSTLDATARGEFDALPP